MLISPIYQFSTAFLAFALNPMKYKRGLLRILQAYLFRVMHINKYSDIQNLATIPFIFKTTWLGKIRVLLPSCRQGC